jgi:hypothetical protein
MTRLNRLNVDITATTTRFDSAMTRVRNQMSAFGRAGSVGAGLGGASVPMFGALGGMAGMAGPFIALTAGVAGLSALMREANRLSESNLRAAQQTDMAGLNDAQGAVRRQLGALLAPGGGVATFQGLRDQFSIGGRFQGMGGINADSMTDEEFMRAIVRLANLPDAAERVRLGLLPRELMQARDVDPNLIGRAIENARSGLSNARRFEASRQRSIASGIDDPNFLNDPLGTATRTIRSGAVREFTDSGLLGLLPFVGVFDTVLRVLNQGLDNWQQTAENTNSQGPGL